MIDSTNSIPFSFRKYISEHSLQLTQGHGRLYKNKERDIPHRGKLPLFKTLLGELLHTIFIPGYFLLACFPHQGILAIFDLLGRKEIFLDANRTARSINPEVARLSASP